MRSIYLVAYDVSDTKRRTKIFNRLKGYGEAVQYSLFRCALSPSEKIRMRSALWDLLNHATDRILLVDLGPDTGRGKESLEAWGKSLDDPASHDGILIV